MRHVRMPSAGTVIAVIALFVALGGTGFAASQATTAKKKRHAALTTRTVNKLIAKYFAKNRAQLVGSTGATGAPGAPGTPGATGATGAAGANATKLFVQVRSGTPPTTLRSSGVSSIQGPDDTGTPGFYIVTFNQDVSGCVAVGSGASKDGNFPGIETVSANHQSANQIGVQTADEDAAGKLTPSTRDFSLAVLC